MTLNLKMEDTNELYELALYCAQNNNLHGLRLLNDNPYCDLSFNNNIILSIAHRKKYKKLVKFLLRNKSIRRVLKRDLKREIYLSYFERCPMYILVDLGVSKKSTNTLSTTNSTGPLARFFMAIWHCTLCIIRAFLCFFLFFILFLCLVE